MRTETTQSSLNPNSNTRWMAFRKWHNFQGLSFLINKMSNNSNYLIGFVLAALCSMQDLSFPTRCWNCTPCSGSTVLATGPPGKSLLIGFLKVKVIHSCPTLCNPIDCTVHGTILARILECVAYSLLQGMFPTHGLNSGLLHSRQILFQLSHAGSPRILEWVAYHFPWDPPDLRIEPGSPALQMDSVPAELPGKPTGFLRSSNEIL